MINKIVIILIFLSCFLTKAQKQNYVIKNIKVNNRYSNFGTTFFGKNKVVYASPKKKSYIIRNIWKGNNQPFLDLFIADIDEDGELTNATQFSKNLNTRYHEADVAFTKDKKTVYFSRNNYYNKKLTRDSTGTGLIQLYRANIDLTGTWVNIEPMPFNNDEYQTGHPTLCADEKTLYFISDMPGGFGKTDVYKASIDKNGNIGEPINMGSKINTPEREMFSSISGNDELYFSSDGRENSLGQLDIYVSQISEAGITEPLNLGAPINSDKDDFSFIVNYESRRGYFSSNRNGGKGDDDIYTFNQEFPIVFECKQEVSVVVTDQTNSNLLPNSLVKLFNDKGKAIDSLIVGSNASYNFKVDCNRSFVVTASKKGYIDVSKSFFSVKGEGLKIPLSLDLGEFIIENGRCVVKINPNNISSTGYGKTQLEKACSDGVQCLEKEHQCKRSTEFVILKNNEVKSVYSEKCDKKVIPTKDEIKNYSSSNLINIAKEEKHKRSTDIIDFENNSEFVLKNEKVYIKSESLYFELNSSYLEANATKILNKIIQIMTKYPAIQIECSSHTDSRASYKYNKWLSDRRAKRIVDYVVKRGINSSRISGVGYGESQLVNKCVNNVMCSEVAHRKNRRIEFVIKNVEFFGKK